MVLEKLADVLADAVEFGREIILSSILGQLEFLDDSGFDELLEVLTNRRSALARYRCRERNGCKRD